ncbi:BREX-1 system phosphatase PglZ type A [Qipengyuania gaetbuli]|uniref:BREX-1 system phosphatase PglZ type A n=1 Tax=Qipengyuania gaetbuli TaxID=266952 RepID=UPI001CFC8C32|nr:BREX-1 system phosphatase PglZ type A [Qipengyuania gaetbuli]
MKDKLEYALKAKFSGGERQIVFWYDTAEEFADDFAALDLPGVEKVEVQNNEFALKHRMLREQPEQHFLVYARGSQPEDIDNWLLDVLLSHSQFRTDKVQMWLDELGLPGPFAGLLEEHQAFFGANARYEELKRLIEPSDSRTRVRMKMVAVCLGVHPDIDAIVEALLGGLAKGEENLARTMGLLERCRLAEFLWEQFAERFGYRAETPSIGDFAIALFRASYAADLGAEAELTSDAHICFKRWKNGRTTAADFEILSAEFAEALNVEEDLERRDFRDLMRLDQYEAIDRKIIRALVHEVAEQTVSHAEVERWVRERKGLHWFATFEPIYEAILAAARFLYELAHTSLEVKGFDQGIDLYATRWFRLDQLYREFIKNADQSKQATSLLSELTEQVENRYSNQFLLTLNDNWQAQVDAADTWNSAAVTMQTDFYRSKVRPVRHNGQKVCVIISDALRYEVGEELQRRIRSLDRFTAELEPGLSALPSYTQLGMAALLPHRELKIEDKATVLVDGQSASGLQNREKILTAGASGERCKALKFEELMELVKDDARELIREHDVIYVYHDRIDAMGDKPGTERQVFEAVEDTFKDLESAVRKLMSANASKILITADHGFLFQARKIDESDYASAGVTGKDVVFVNRRYALGRGLEPSASVKTFTSAAAGLSGDLEVQIPKSINRLRKSGSGARFVHGGASLQEIVIPILTVSKSRASDVELVEVEILAGDSRLITTSQLGVKLYQSEPVDDKIQSRELKIGIYSLDGDLLSDEQTLVFDSTSIDPRDRERSIRLLLTRKADDHNNQEVILKLSERHKNTSAFKDYRTVRYTLRRRQTDFDF